MNAPVRRSRSKGVRQRTPWGSYNAAPADALLPYPVAQSLRDRSQFWWLRPCPVCRQPRVMKAFTKTCGRNCGAVLIGINRSPAHVAAMQARGRASQVAAAIARDLAVIAAQALDPIAAYRLGKRRGERSGYEKGRLAERRQWEAA